MPDSPATTLKRASMTVIAAAAFIARPARGTTYHWAVPSGTWSVASNWSPTAVPGAGDTAVLDYFSGAQISVASNVGAPAEVDINNSDTVTLTKPGVLGSGTTFFAIGAAMPGVNGIGTLELTTSNPTFPPQPTVSAYSMLLGVSSGSGAINESAGSLSASLITVGDSSASGSTVFGRGTYNLSRGNLSCSNMFIAYGGGTAGTFNLSSVGVATFGYLAVGDRNWAFHPERRRAHRHQSRGNR